MTEVIASLALATSILALVVLYRNQIERRHGEIAKLRSESLAKLAGMQPRLTAIQMHMETARIELRRAKDCDGKYTAIEAMPLLLQSITEEVKSLAELKNTFTKMDTTKMNRSTVLVTLQSLENTWRELDNFMSDTEQKALDILMQIRSVQETEGTTDGGESLPEPLQREGPTTASNATS